MELGSPGPRTDRVGRRLPGHEVDSHQLRAAHHRNVCRVALRRDRDPARVGADRDSLHLPPLLRRDDAQIPRAPVRDQDVAAVGGNGHDLRHRSDLVRLVDLQALHVDPVHEAVVVPGRRRAAVASLGTEVLPVHRVVRDVRVAAVGREGSFDRRTSTRPWIAGIPECSQVHGVRDRPDELQRARVVDRDRVAIHHVLCGHVAGSRRRNRFRGDVPADDGAELQPGLVGRTRFDLGCLNLRLRDGGRARHRLDSRFDGLRVARTAEERCERDGCEDCERHDRRDEPAATDRPTSPCVAWVGVADVSHREAKSTSYCVYSTRARMRPATLVQLQRSTAADRAAARSASRSSPRRASTSSSRERSAAASPFGKLASPLRPAG